MSNFDKSTGSYGSLLRMVITYTQSQGDNSTTFTVKFQIINKSSGTFAYDIDWTGNTAGTSRSGSVDVTSVATYTVGSYTVKKTHSSDGTLGAQSFSFSIPSTGTSGLGGPTTVSTSISVPRIGTVPGKPGQPVASNITYRAVTISWPAPSDDGGPNIDLYLLRRNTTFPPDGSGYTNVSSANNRSRTDGSLVPATRYYYCVYAHNSLGYSERSNNLTVDTLPIPPDTPSMSPILQTGIRLIWADNNGPLRNGWDVQASTDSAFGSSTTTTVSVSQSGGPAGTYTFSTLKPGTTYYFRVRAKTSSGGVSAWSGVRAGATNPKAAPTISVTAAVSGRSATVTLGAPGPNFVNFIIERKNAAGQVFTQTTTQTSATFTGLTPGATYQWRATGVYGANVSTDPSAWVTLKQPSPNTSPGDYFDGSTAALTDSTFAWTSTVNKSTSVAKAYPPTGWRAYPGSRAVMQRVTGGMFGSYAALATVLADQLVGDAAFAFGLGTPADSPQLPPVLAGAPYFGAIHVQPSKVQPMQVVIVWYNAAGSEVAGSRSYGDVVLASPDEPTRLIAGGTAPDGATKARVYAADVPSAGGWSPWHGGDTVLLDGASLTLSSLYPYFDGSTAADASYTYAWLGDTNLSQSVRLVNTAAVDLLADPDCPPIPTAPRPPVVDNSCVEEILEWSRYWGVIKAGQVSEFFDAVPVVTLSTGDAAERQIRVRFYANPFERSFEQINNDDWCSDQIISYMPANTTLTLDGVSTRAWAQVRGSAAVPASHLLYGSDDQPPTWPVLSCGISYFIVVDTPTDDVQGNVSVQVDLVGRYQ